MTFTTNNSVVSKLALGGMNRSELKFNVKEEADYCIRSFMIDGVLNPKDLATLTPPKVDGSKVARALIR